MRWGRLAIVVALGCCGCTSPPSAASKAEPSTGPGSAAPAGDGTSPASYFTVSSDQLTASQGRARPAGNLVDDRSDHRYGRLGQRTYDSSDHPGQRADLTHRRGHRQARQRRRSLAVRGECRRQQRHRGVSQSQESLRSRAAHVESQHRPAGPQGAVTTRFRSRPGGLLRRCHGSADGPGGAQDLRCVTGRDRRRRTTELGHPARTGDARAAFRDRGRTAGTARTVHPGRHHPGVRDHEHVDGVGAGPCLRPRPDVNPRGRHRRRPARVVPGRLSRRGVVHRRRHRARDPDDAGADRHAERRQPAQEGPLRRRGDSRPVDARRARRPDHRGPVPTNRTFRSSTCRSVRASSHSAR